MDRVSNALLDHYGEDSKKNYRDAVVIFTGVLKRMNLSLAYPEERLPAYRYKPAERNIPAN